MKLGAREGLIGAVLLAVPLASWWMVFRPQNTAIDSAKADIAHKRELLAKLKEFTSRNADLRQANEEMAARIGDIEARLPSDKEVDSIVRQVSDIAVSCGLDSPAVKNVKPRQEAMFMEQPLEMSLAGNWTGYYDFLAKVEQLPRITRISTMKLKRSDEGDGNMKAEFTLSIYYQQSRQAGQPTPGASSGSSTGGKS
jgi:type IV pilus assembly protein PilO